MRRGDGDNTSARHDKPPGSDQKRATSRISPASYRGRKIVARCAGGDPLWQGVAQGHIRYERFWALLATVGGEAVGGSASGVLAITRGPESKMSAAGAQSDSTRHSKYVRKLASTTATHVVIRCRRGSAEKALRHLFEGV